MGLKICLRRRESCGSCVGISKTAATGLVRKASILPLDAGIRFLLPANQAPLQMEANRELMPREIARRLARPRKKTQ